MAAGSGPLSAFREILKPELRYFGVGEIQISERDLYNLVVDLHRSAKADAEVYPENSEKGEAARMRIYVLSAFLFTFGRPEMAEDMLRCMPPERNPARFLLAPLSLIPWPEAIEPRKHPERAIRWLKENGDGLEFNEKHNRFSLKEPATKGDRRKDPK
ncbi:MAG: hypothetical protein GY856_26095 [bacterium]|nr:hypothetical protein [bacterium]